MDILLTIVLFLLCFYVCYYLCSKTESGCLMTLFFYITMLVFVIGELWINGAFEIPKYNRYHIINTVDGAKYEYQNSQRCCPNVKGIYTVIKDSVPPNRHDVCNVCNEPWFKHYYFKSATEREADAESLEGLIIPID